MEHIWKFYLQAAQKLHQSYRNLSELTFAGEELVPAFPISAEGTGCLDKDVEQWTVHLTVLFYNGWNLET